MHSIEITCHMLPKSLNKALRSNRWRAKESNDAWDMHIMALCLGKRPRKPWARARISITRHYYRTLDFDGLVGSLKPVVDALVSAGVIQDDSWNCVGPWAVDQKFRPKSDGPLLQIRVDRVT